MGGSLADLDTWIDLAVRVNRTVSRSFSCLNLPFPVRNTSNKFLRRNGISRNISPYLHAQTLAMYSVPDVGHRTSYPVIFCILTSAINIPLNVKNVSYNNQFSAVYQSWTWHVQHDWTPCLCSRPISLKKKNGTQQSWIDHSAEKDERIARNCR